MMMIYGIAVRVSTTGRNVARDLPRTVILAVAVTPTNRPKADVNAKLVSDIARQQRQPRSRRSTAATSRHLPWRGGHRRHRQPAPLRTEIKTRQQYCFIVRLPDV
jgi:hypothetical protein